MGTIATTTETFGGGDYRWLKSARGTEHPQSGTLDTSTFTEGTHYPNGYFPSGLPVYFNAASGLYEPFDGSTGDTSEVWTFTEGGSGLTSWTFTPSGGTASGSLDDDISAADLQTAIDAKYGEGNIIVTGGPFATGAFTLTVNPDGELANTNLTPPTTTPTGGTGVVTVATATGGSAGLDGFVFHDVDATQADPAVAILTDVTVDADYLPVATGLSSGRYICDAVASEA